MADRLGFYGDSPHCVDVEVWKYRAEMLGFSRQVGRPPSAISMSYFSMRNANKNGLAQKISWLKVEEKVV
eukprot:scaffold30372_cov70-Cyclotella_meneghiniana.AAC.3